MERTLRETNPVSSPPPGMYVRATYIERERRCPHDGVLRAWYHCVAAVSISRPVMGDAMGHGVTEYTCRMIFRRVSGLGFVISTLNNAGDRPYPENSGGREIDPPGSWYPSGESPGLSQLPKPSWHLTCQTALSAHPLRAPACARPYTCAMPKPPRAPPGAPPRPVVRASPPSHRAPVGRPG